MKAFIAAMAPKDETVEAFWQMVLENNVSLIVMLCQIEENSKVLNLL